MKRRFSSLLAMFTLTTGLVVSVAQAQTPSAPSTLDRSVLPIPEPKLTPITELDARNAKAPPRIEVKTPEGAPNVLIVLIDDMGFGQSSAFGGPINMPTLERTNATLVGRPDLMAGRTSLTVFEGMKGMSENVFINTKNRSHSITANVEVSDGGANGVILAQAGRFGGFSLYLNYGKPTYAYNFLGLKTFKVAANKAIPAGKATIRFEFTYDGGGLGKGGKGTILVNGGKVAEGRLEHTQAMIFSADEGADVGFDGETPVSDDYKEGNNKFTGKIRKVTIEIGELKLGAAEHHELHKSALARKAAE